MRILRHPSDLAVTFGLAVAAILFALFAPVPTLYIMGILFVIGLLVGASLMRREE